MLRDKNLIPLSHQHQQSLALCVRLSKAINAGAVEVKVWQVEIAQHYESEVRTHFAAEEKEIFPRAVAFPELVPLVEELKAEHEVLREGFLRASEYKLDLSGLQQFGALLSGHIRKEERRLFEALQQRMSAEELMIVGKAIDLQLAALPKVCGLRGQAAAASD